MTDRAVRKRRKPSPVTVFAVSGALFLAALGFLAMQLARGNDPSLGAGALASTKPQRPVVIVRKVIRRRVITTVVPAQSGGTVYAAGGYSSSTAPTVAAAPAPAPAAPVVTASS